jgi:hypothetical protein
MPIGAHQSHGFISPSYQLGLMIMTVVKIHCNVSMDGDIQQVVWVEKPSR